MVRSIPGDYLNDYFFADYCSGRIWSLDSGGDGDGQSPDDDAPGDEEAVATVTTEIQAAVKERKGSVQSPKQVIVVDSVPVTALGKPDKKALRARAKAPSASLLKAMALVASRSPEPR